MTKEAGLDSANKLLSNFNKIRSDDDLSTILFQYENLIRSNSKHINSVGYWEELERIKLDFNTAKSLKRDKHSLLEKVKRNLKVDIEAFISELERGL
tara:strand:+ start:3768 stop:4058 length:291 start_codon:yes stop_codon:yes gene_type:complete